MTCSSLQPKGARPLSLDNGSTTNQANKRGRHEPNSTGHIANHRRTARSARISFGTNAACTGSGQPHPARTHWQAGEGADPHIAQCAATTLGRSRMLRAIHHEWPRGVDADFAGTNASAPLRVCAPNGCDWGGNCASPGPWREPCPRTAACNKHRRHSSAGESETPPSKRLTSSLRSNSACRTTARTVCGVACASHPNARKLRPSYDAKTAKYRETPLNMGPLHRYVFSSCQRLTGGRWRAKTLSNRPPQRASDCVLYSRCLTPSFSPSSSARVLLMHSWLNASIGRPSTILYSPPSQVTG